MFLTMMIWFVFDEEKSLKIFEDEHHSYPILEVVKVNNNSIICDDSYSSEEDANHESDNTGDDIFPSS